MSETLGGQRLVQVDRAQREGQPGALAVSGGGLGEQADHRLQGSIEEGRRERHRGGGRGGFGQTQLGERLVPPDVERAQGPHGLAVLQATRGEGAVARLRGQGPRAAGPEHLGGRAGPGVA
ncbi:hypothetical protein NR798_13750 [Archangium gephyra]